MAESSLVSQPTRCQICSDDIIVYDEETHWRGHDRLMFRCTLCSPLFLTRDAAFDHAKTIHGAATAENITFPLDVRSIECRRCQQRMLSQGIGSMVIHLQDHQIGVGADVSKVADEANLGCRLCDFSTSKVEAWESHFNNAYSSCKQMGNETSAGERGKRPKVGQRRADEKKIKRTSASSSSSSEFSNTAAASSSPPSRWPRNDTNSNVEVWERYLRCKICTTSGKTYTFPELEAHVATDHQLQILGNFVNLVALSRNLGFALQSPKKSSNHFYCQLCGIEDLRSRRNYKEHCKGKKHLLKKANKQPLWQARPTQPNEMSYSCDICGVSRRSLDAMHGHMESPRHTNKALDMFNRGVRSFWCLICQKHVAVTFPGDLKDHVRSVDHRQELSKRNGEVGPKCVVCGKNVFVFDSEGRHMLETAERPSTCENCAAEVPAESRYNAPESRRNEQLIEARKETESKWVEEDTCNDDVGDKSASGEPEEEHCSFCCQMVSQKALVRHHILTHKSHLFKCGLGCRDAYNISEKGIRKHMADIHQYVSNPRICLPVDLAYLLCLSCQPVRKFCACCGSTEALEHVSRCGPTDVSVPAQCRLCNRAFPDRAAMDLHPCSVHFGGGGRHTAESAHLEELQRVVSASHAEKKVTAAT